MERTIGNLGQEVKQPSNPFTNLSERGVRRSQVNALKAMLLELDKDDGLPRGSINLGDSYVLLRAMERSAKFVNHFEVAAINSYIQGLGLREQEHDAAEYQVTRWARLRLPNGQIARSAWKERSKPLGRLRTARMIKVCLNAFTLFLLLIHCSMNPKFAQNLEKYCIISDYEFKRLRTPLLLSPRLDLLTRIS